MPLTIKIRALMLTLVLTFYDISLGYTYADRVSHKIKLSLI